MVVSDSDHGTLVWGLREAKERFFAPTSKSAAISPDGSQLALMRGHVEIVDLHTGKQIRQLTLEEMLPRDGAIACFSSDGQLLVAGMNDVTSYPSYLVVWKTTDYSSPVVFACHNHCIVDMCFLPKTHTLVTASADRTLSFWDLDKSHGAQR